MTRPFRFGVQGGPFMDAAALRGHARMVEDLGYDELFTADHLGAADPFLPLVVAAESTTRLRFGPLVLNNEFHNTALLARTAATFDVLTDGRLVLGLGTGYAQDEHDGAGIELRPPGPRVSRFDESLFALRSLLDDNSCVMHGEHVRLDIEKFDVRPAQYHVPFLIGGHGRRVVKLAATHADIFQFTGLTHDPVTGAPGVGGFGMDQLAQRHRWLTEGAAAAGRVGQIELSALVQHTDVSGGWSVSADEMIERLGVDRDLVDETPFIMFGSVDAVCEKILGVRERLGISHFVVREPEAFAPVVARLAGN